MGNNISCGALRRMELVRQANLVVLDVRTPREFELGHIQGARNVPIAKIQSAGFVRDAAIIVYCAELSCKLSDEAARMLIDRGFKNVSMLDGGLARWQESGYPVERSGPYASNAAIPERTADQAAELSSVGQIILLDVRPASEFAAGRLHGAQNIPLEKLESDLSSLPKSREILVYDRFSKRSKQAARTLLKAGYRVSELSGGLAAWTAGRRALEAK